MHPSSRLGFADCLLLYQSGCVPCNHVPELCGRNCSVFFNQLLVLVKLRSEFLPVLLDKLLCNALDKCCLDPSHFHSSFVWSNGFAIDSLFVVPGIGLLTVIGIKPC